jgi:hypothetical protein
VQPSGQRSNSRKSLIPWLFVCTFPLDGFGDQKLLAYLAQLGLGYVIRFRGNIHVTDANGTTKSAAEWVGRGGRARKLTDARVTTKGQHVGAVVCVHAKDMQEPWCLASSEREATAATLI